MIALVDARRWIGEYVAAAYAIHTLPIAKGRMKAAAFEAAHAAADAHLAEYLYRCVF